MPSGVRARPARDRQDLVDDEIGLGRGCPVEGVGLVGELDVPGIPILVGVHGDRGDATVTGGTDDAHRNLSTIGNQDLGDAGHNT